MLRCGCDREWGNDGGLEWEMRASSVGERERVGLPFYRGRGEGERALREGEGRRRLLSPLMASVNERRVNGGKRKS
jgi:hypothetical protein